MSKRKSDLLTLILDRQKSLCKTAIYIDYWVESKPFAKYIGMYTDIVVVFKYLSLLQFIGLAKVRCSWEKIPHLNSYLPMHWSNN